MDASNEQIRTIIILFGKVLGLAGQALDIDMSTSLQFTSLDQVPGQADPLAGHSKEQPLEKDALSDWRELEIHLTLDEMRKHGLKTNDIVQIKGDPDGLKIRKLFVNGGGDISLDRREYIVLRILAKERKNGGGYLAVKDILEQIQDKKAQFEDKNGDEDEKEFWMYPGDEDIHNAVSRLRNKLRNAGYAPSLIESGARGAGYRISTRAINILISLDKI